MQRSDLNAHPIDFFLFSYKVLQTRSDLVMFYSPHLALYCKISLTLLSVFAGAFLAGDEVSRTWLIEGALAGLQSMVKSLPIFFSLTIALMMGILTFRK